MAAVSSGVEIQLEQVSHILIPLSVQAEFWTSTPPLDQYSTPPLDQDSTLPSEGEAISSTDKSEQSDDSRRIILFQDGEMD